MLRLSKTGEDIILIQEPWVNNLKICGLSLKGYNLFQGKINCKVRTCILVKQQLNAFLIENFSNEDLTTIALELPGRNIWLSAAYMPYEEEAPPSALVRKLVQKCNMSNQSIIIAADANAHHYVWGSSNVNKRGESLYNFILDSRLCIANKGDSPTFINSITKQVIDITLCDNLTFDKVVKWRVAKEHSFSDHCYITFEIIASQNNHARVLNKRLMDWQKFSESLSSSLLTIEKVKICNSKDLDKIVDAITKAYGTAAKNHVPL